VFCHAGGNSAFYRPWDALLTPEVSLIVIELPGRLTRFKEPVISGNLRVKKQGRRERKKIRSGGEM
jgi:surfactin synthase thioesterase subunit